MTIIEQIKTQLDIVKVISGYLELKKQGRNYVACCPFHAEKTPSFYVSPDRQRWRCFGACATGGDLLDFIIKKESLASTVDAIKILAPMAGVVYEESGNSHKYDRLYALLIESSTYYHDCLRHKTTGQKARDYILGRSFTYDTLKTWRIGYAPMVWDGLIKYLQEHGYTRDEILETGMGQIHQGKLVDRFLDRLMIPISDANGRVIGFGGRTMADRKPKYLNTPQTVLFNKSAVLFGLNFAKSQIRTTNAAIVVEGYFDVIQAHQSGFANVVAQMGTALTDLQAKALSKFSPTIIMALDPDKAGQAATERGVNLAAHFAMAERTVIDLKIMALPPGQDPDLFIKNNPDEWLNATQNALPAVDYMIESAAHTLPENPTFKDREGIAIQLLPILLGTRTLLAAEDHIRKLATRLNLPEDSLISWVHEQAKQNKKPVVEQPPDDYPLERAFVMLLCHNPGVIAWIRRRFRELFCDFDPIPFLTGSDFNHWQYRAIWEQVNRAFDSSIEQSYDESIKLPADLMELFKSLYTDAGESYLDNDLKHANTLAPLQALRIKLAALQRANNEIYGRTDQANQYVFNMRYIFIINMALRGTG